MAIERLKKEGTDMSVRQKTVTYDIVVVGGGLSGMCAAIAAARNGAKVAIVQNRSVFGGNASSEIRMHIVGANCHSSKANLRETGILEEILLENKYRNPYSVFPVFDMIMWEKVYLQDNLTIYLNTNMDDVIMGEGQVRGILCHQQTTETEITIYGKIFVDATGHGTLSVMAGASYRIGCESRHEFNEPTAPEQSNMDTMGNTLMFIATDRGEPVKFKRPIWAYHFTEEDLRYRPHVDKIIAHADGGAIVDTDEKKNQLPGFFAVDSGYWWIELGGQYEDIIGEGEEIRDELMKCVYGVWDHLKNVSDHGLENYDLEWVGMVPGYRESRRIEGDYVLTENDIRANRVFDDAVAYGGWPMDNHVRGGILDFDKYPSEIFNFEGCYTIPYRCYCSKDIGNLMLAGRNISTSKMAFTSTRVMGTCAVGGQAVGTAAAMAIRYGCSPKEIGKEHIDELQQALLKQDCFIPGFSNRDDTDLARGATVVASSETLGAQAINVINGVARSIDNAKNYWESARLTEYGEKLTLRLSKESNVREVRVTFDTDLSHEIMPSISRNVCELQVKGLPVELVKDYTVTLSKNGETVAQKEITDNYQRINAHIFDKMACDEVSILVKGTHGLERARIYEVRIY